MANSNYIDQYSDDLSQWHSELLAVRDLAELLFNQIEGYDDKVGNASRVLFVRFDQVIESMPFPDQPVSEIIMREEDI